MSPGSISSAVELVDQSSITPHSKSIEPTINVLSVGEDGVVDNADKGLEALGYQPQLRRNRGQLQIQTMMLTVFGIPFAISSGFNTGMIAGGPAVLFWGYLLIGLIEECIAISLGEIQSYFPTSGGPYYWTYVLSTSSYRGLLSYITGWLYMIAIWMLSLGSHYSTTLLIFGAVNIALPDYVPSAWVLLLVTYGIFIYATLLTWKGAKWVPIIDTANAYFTGAGIVAITISLLACAKEGRRSAKFAFTDYDPSSSGWGEGFSFFIGLLPGSFVMVGVGWVTAMSEEVARPAVQIPRAMVIGIALATLSGLCFILGILFTLPDVVDVLAAPGGQSVAYVLGVATGSKAGGIILQSIVIVNAMIACPANLLVASRTTWAFARDRALPFPHFWAAVDRDAQPRNSLLGLVAIQMLVCLLVLGSSTALNAFLNVGIIGINMSYGIPIAISLFGGRHIVKKAPWHFGLLGWVCNIVATVWSAFALVLFCMPIQIPVTKTSMNYAVVVFVGFMSISAVYYMVHARKIYRGPPELKLN